MSQDSYFYEPARGHGLPHNPFNAIIAPRPIGWISSHSPDGVLNLAPYSFFNAFNYRPPLVGFASNGYKDSVHNIERTGEFGWNLVTRALAEAMNQCSASAAPEVDEFQLAGLTPEPSRVIAVPRVKQTPVSFECRLSQLLRLTAADGTETDTWMVFGEVVGVHIARHLLKDGIYDTAAAEPVVRAGGPADYFRIDPKHRFQMYRPA